MGEMANSATTVLFECFMKHVMGFDLWMFVGALVTRQPQCCSNVCESL